MKILRFNQPPRFGVNYIVTYHIVSDFDYTQNIYRMCELLSESRKLTSSSIYMHPGVLIWRFGRNPFVNPHRNIKLWEDVSGKLIGFTWFYPPEDFEIQLHPHHLDDELLSEMVSWCEERMSAMIEDIRKYDIEYKHVIDRHFIRVNQDDTHLIRLLKSRSYQKQKRFHHIIFSQELDKTIISKAAYVKSSEFTIRAFKGEEEIDKRVKLHHDVWGAGVSKMTVGSYRYMMNLKGYNRDLDLVAVSPDGKLVAYTTCWIDEINRDAEFEPVGTYPDYRGQSLAQALLTEGMKRAMELGAGKIQVRCGNTNKPAVSLYKSTEFEESVKDYFYYK